MYHLRFEHLYSAHIKRLAVKEATDVKNAMISGLWANTNLDDGKQTRQNLLREIEESYQNSISLIYSRQDAEIDYELESDPLFSAMNLDEVSDSEKFVPEPTTQNLPDFDVDQI